MKSRLTFLLFLLVSIGLHGQTIEVQGPQTGVWDADTVLVVSDIEVVDSLMVAPGTVVLFDGYYGVTIPTGASFIAQGTESDSIRFTVADTTGLFIYNFGKGGWNGFQMEKAGKVRFDYCVLEYAKASDTTDMSGGAMQINSCNDVEISHSTLHFNRAREHGGAVSAENSRVVMTDCNVNDNLVFTDDNIYSRYGGALRFLKCDVELRVMEFLRNDGEGCIGGAIGLDSCSLVLDRAVFANNVGINGGGLYLVRSNHLEGRLSNLLFNHNHSRHFGGGMAICDASPEVYNILVTNNDSEGVTCTGIFFYQYSSPKFTNCIIYGNYPETNTFLPDSVIIHTDTVQMWVWTFEGCAPEFRNCLIEGGTKYITNSDYIKVFEDIVETDPLFVDAENDDFRLGEESPCRDAGSTEVPDELAEGLDLIGIRRVSNQRIDIGPYEYSAASVPSLLANPVRARLVGNPLSAKSRIEFDDVMEGSVEVTVYSLTGRKVVSQVYAIEKTDSLVIGSMVERLASGVYLIEVTDKEGSFALKAVK